MSSDASTESFFPALLRAFWMLLGNGVLLIVALTIARMPPWTLSWRDAFYAGALVCLLWSRWTDALHYGGTTAQDQPITRAQLLRWSATVVLCCTALWLGAQSIGF